MYERLRTRARRVEREPEAPQPAGGRPPRDAVDGQLLAAINDALIARQEGTGR
jgi:hypothetical protein